MKQKTAFVILSWLCVSLFLPGQDQTASAQGPAPFPPCVPPAQSDAQGGARGPGLQQQGQPARGAAQPRIPRDVSMTEIPGVVLAGAKWKKVWQGAGNSADG